VNQSYIVIDTTYLCYRSFFALDGLKFRGLDTSIIFGVLRDIYTLRNTFCTDNLIFCFDHGRGLREQEHSFYKANRRGKELSPNEQLSRASLREQTANLKFNILNKLGFVNVLFTDGYEADDVIASVVKRQRTNALYTIVSADEDLFQLLTDDINMYNPRSKQVFTNKCFMEKYGIEPQQWPMVKAIAGCKTDNIPGIYRVGEKTAIKYLTGKLEQKSPGHKAIVSGEEIWKRNLDLVSLPYKNCPRFPIKMQEPIEDSAWKKVMDRYGIASLGKE